MAATPPITTSINGRVTANTSDSDGCSEMAITSAATSIPGARSAILSIILTKFCSCVTSLVSRVTSEPVENLSILANEYFCTEA